MDGVSSIQFFLGFLKKKIHFTKPLSPHLHLFSYRSNEITVFFQISWQSATLGFWFTDLIDRHAQFFSWVFEGRPNIFWMTGFFNPQGFLTAMRQEVTRAHKGWALDLVNLDNEVTKMMKEDVVNAPNEGRFFSYKLGGY